MGASQSTQAPSTPSTTTPAAPSSCKERRRHDDAGKSSRTSPGIAPATASAVHVWDNPYLRIELLSFAGPRGLGKASRLSTAMRREASHDRLWRPLLTARWPHLPSSLLAAIPAGGAKQLYRSRVAEAYVGEGARLSRREREAEEERLRQEMRGTYVEVCVKHSGTGAPLASRVLPLVGDDATTLALFQGEPVTVLRADAAQPLDFENIAVTVALLRAGPQQPRSLLLAGSGAPEGGQLWARHGVTTETRHYGSTCRLATPTASHLNAEYAVATNLLELTHKGRGSGAWELAVAVFVGVRYTFPDYDDDDEEDGDDETTVDVLFYSVPQVLRFLRLLLTPGAVWRKA